MNREAVAQALLALIQAPLQAAGAVSVTRRLLHWSDVPPVNQPAVMIAQGDQTPEQHTDGRPALWRLNFNIYLYAFHSDPAETPATRLNNLLDALETALAPTIPGRKQTLGGTVEHCWISGRVETDEGVLGDQAMAIVPIEVLIP